MEESMREMQTPLSGLASDGSDPKWSWNLPFVSGTLEGSDV
jgi:hypothetical protein